MGKEGKPRVSFAPAPRPMVPATPDNVRAALRAADHFADPMKWLDAIEQEAHGKLADGHDERAARMLAYVRYARRAEADGDIRAAMHWMRVLGAIDRESDLADEFEAPAAAGLKQREGGKRGANVRHGDEEARKRNWRARAASVRKHLDAGEDKTMAVRMAMLDHGLRSESPIWEALAKCREIDSA